LGIGGIVRRLFSRPGELTEFERTVEYAEIQLMLARLRQRTSPRSAKPEPIRVITVRMPQSLHEALHAEANAHHTSINRLCITKLLRVVDGDSTEGTEEVSPQTIEQVNP
jgi:hypothetical protein